MDKQRCQQMIEVMQAYIDGKQIEYYNLGKKEWVVVDNPSWNWVHAEYRVVYGTTKPSIDLTSNQIFYTMQTL